jgi:hypothetical protein
MANAWNEATWGQNAFGEQSDVNQTLTGEALTTSLGNEIVTADCNVTPTGVAITAFEGTPTEIIAVEVFPSGLSFTANLGIADASPDAIVSGVTASASVGSVEAYNLTGWSRYFYGQFVWGATGDWVQVDLTGVSLSANLGTVDAAPDAEVTGIGFNASLAVGTVIIGEGNVAVTGEPITATLDNVIAFTDVDVDTTGIALSANLGNESIVADANLTLTGFDITAAEGIVDPAPDAEVTGIGFDASLAIGTVVIGEANVTVVGEGFGAALGVGNLDAVTFAATTGIAMSANLGSVTVTGEATTGITGIGLTMALGNNRTLIWNQVNTGTAPTWREVDTAA